MADGTSKAGVQVYDPQTGALAHLTPDEALKELVAGRRQLVTALDYPMRAPDGSIWSIPAKEVGDAMRKGATFASQSEVTREEAKSTESGAQAAAEGALRPLGGDAILTSLGADPEAIQARQDEWPVAAGVGTAVTALGLPIALGAAAPAAIAARGVQMALGEQLAGAAAGRLAAFGLGQAAEGAAVGLGMGVSEAALGKSEDAAETILANVGAGSLLSGVVGTGARATGMGVGALVRGGRARLQDWAKLAANAAGETEATIATARAMRADADEAVAYLRQADVAAKARAAEHAEAVRAAPRLGVTSIDDAAAAGKLELHASTEAVKAAEKAHKLNLGRWDAAVKAHDKVEAAAVKSEPGGFVAMVEARAAREAERAKSLGAYAQEVSASEKLLSEAHAAVEAARAAGPARVAAAKRAAEAMREESLGAFRSGAGAATDEAAEAARLAEASQLAAAEAEAKLGSVALPGAARQVARLALDIPVRAVGRMFGVPGAVSGVASDAATDALLSRVRAGGIASLQRGASEALERIDEAAGAMFARTAPRAEAAATRLGPLTAAMLTGSADEREAAFKERAAEVEAMATNPEATADAWGARTAALGRVAPEATGVLHQRMAAALEYIRGAVPGTAGGDLLAEGADAIQVPEHARMEFARVDAALQDPTRILRPDATGAEVDAVASVYPKMHATMARALTAKASVKMSWEGRKRLGVNWGAYTHTALEPSSLSILQASYAPKPPGPGRPRKPRGREMSGSMSDADRIAYKPGRR